MAATLAKRYLTARRLPDSAIDIVDETCGFQTPVLRFIFMVLTCPFQRSHDARGIARGQRPARARRRNSCAQAREGHSVQRPARYDIDEQLRPPRAAFEERKRRDEVATVRRRIDELRVKADDAARYDFLGWFPTCAIPELQKKLEQLECASICGCTHVEPQQRVGHLPDAPSGPYSRRPGCGSACRQ